MKNLMLCFAMVFAIVSVAFAGEGGGHQYGHYKFIKVIKKKTINVYKTENVTNEVTEIVESEIKNEYGAKLDAPNLVRLADNWFVGVEGGKDLYQTNSDEGWFAYGKVTYTGTWFDLRKKNKTVTVSNSQ